MQTQKINFTMLYGVERNYKGTEQRRYIYTGEQLVRLENRNRKTFGVYSRGFHPENIPQAMTEADLDGLESGFWSNDTYVIQKINSEEELKKFLFVPKEGICDCEDPSLRALADTWSTLCTDCMYTGEENETMALILAVYGDGARKIRDPRYQKLLDLGMPEEDFCFDWPDGDAYRYCAICENLKNGTYHELRDNLDITR